MKKKRKEHIDLNFAILCSTGILEDSILRTADKKVLFELIINASFSFLTLETFQPP